MGNAFIVCGSMSSHWWLQKGLRPSSIMMALTVLCVGVTVLVVSFVERWPWMMWCASPLVGFSIGLFNVCVSICIADIAPPKRIGLVSGIRLFVLDLGFGAGPLIAAILYERSADFTWYIQTAAYMAAFVMCFVFHVAYRGKS